MDTFDNLREELLKRGFQEQRDGVCGINGTRGTNFLSPSGDLIHLSSTDMPDYEEVEDLFGKENADKFYDDEDSDVDDDVDFNEIQRQIEDKKDEATDLAMEIIELENQICPIPNDFLKQKQEGENNG
jgi:hypothetical protein